MRLNQTEETLDENLSEFVLQVWLSITISLNRDLEYCIIILLGTTLLDESGSVHIHLENRYLYEFEYFIFEQRRKKS